LVQAPTEGPKVVAGRRGLGATPRPEGEPVNGELPRGLWWAFKSGRKPKEIYVDNGSCFISKEFRQFCHDHHIRLIYGRPYNPQGRGKLERFHRILTQELVGRVYFQSLGHFRRELRRWRKGYNHTRLHGAIGWKTPSEVYHDRRLMRKQRVRGPEGRSHVLAV
jgi:transposase InsO family protein